MKPRILSLLPEEDRALSRLWLNATDAAKVCGVTVRQLTYWTDKGIIPGGDHSGRSYDVPALRRAIAIDRAMLGGLTLEKASRMLDEASLAGTPQGLLSVGAAIDDLVTEIEGFRRKLPAYLAAANFRRAASALEAVDVGVLVGSGPETGAIAQRVAARLNAVADVVDSATADLVVPTPETVSLGEMASAVSSV